MIQHVDVDISAERGTVIELLNHRGERYASAVSRLVAQVQHGVYEVRRSAGGASTSKVVTLLPGCKPFVWTPEDLLPLARSLAPINGQAYLPASVLDAAAQVSVRPRRSFGQGGRLLLFTTTISGAADVALPNSPISKFVALQSLDGNLVGQINDAWQSGRDDKAAWSGIAVDLPPGAYRLEVQRRTGGRKAGTRHEFIQQIIQVNKGWQTQVFLARRREQTPNGVSWVFDPHFTSIFVAPLDCPYDPGAEGVRRVELCRYALETNQPGVAAALVEHECSPAAPMADLLALATIATTPEYKNLAGALRQRLERQLPGQTDAAMLAAALDHREMPAVAQSAPPMLLRSWQYSVRLQNTAAIQGSLADRIGVRLYSSGVWLAWEGSSLGHSSQDDQDVARGERVQPPELNLFARVRNSIWTKRNPERRQATPVAPYREQAQRIISIAEARATPGGGGVRWSQAELEGLGSYGVAVATALFVLRNDAGEEPQADTVGRTLSLPASTIYHLVATADRFLQGIK